MITEQNRMDAIRYFRGAKYPAEQVQIVCDLTGLLTGEVLAVLREAGMIPPDVTPDNYRERLPERAYVPMSKELRRYVAESGLHVDELAEQTGTDPQEVAKARKEARRARRRIKKDKAGAAHHAGAPEDADADRGAADRGGGTRHERRRAFRIRR